MIRLILFIICVMLLFRIPIVIYEHYEYPDTPGTAVALEVYSKIIKGNHNIYVKYELTLDNGEVMIRERRPFDFVRNRYDSDEDEKEVDRLMKSVEIRGEPFKIWIDHRRQYWYTGKIDETTPYGLVITFILAVIGAGWAVWPLVRND